MLLMRHLTRNTHILKSRTHCKILLVTFLYIIFLCSFYSVWLYAYHSCYINK